MLLRHVPLPLGYVRAEFEIHLNFTSDNYTCAACIEQEEGMSLCGRIVTAVEDVKQERG